MSKNNQASRRHFLKKLSGSTLAIAATPFAGLAAEEKSEERILAYEKKISANDKIRIGIIGLGIMGYNNLSTALNVPGVELAAACDLYTGRLERAREKYGKDLFTTRDYREVLNRKDIDAVIIATSDNWHARISQEALQKGKAVYCEKPMVHRISEGAGVVEAQRKSSKVMQVGSQRVSSLDHFTNFFEGVRSGKPVVEDAVFGFRAAAPCLACNDSYFEKKIIYWNPEEMRLEKGA